MKKVIKNKGFSVVELIVVIGIFVLMTTLLMFNHQKQSAMIETSDLAEDVALTMRQAQVYGISASDNMIASEKFYDSENGVLVEDKFFNADSGVVKDITHDKSIRGTSIYLDDKKIIIFEDFNRNHVYDGHDRMIDERNVTYKNAHFLGFDLCQADGGCIKKEVGRVDITFERPYPDAVIYHMDNPESVSGATRYDHMAIQIGIDNYQKSVELNSIGSIVVK